MYKYNDKLYTSIEQVNEAIIENIGGNYNNIDVATTKAFEDEWQEVEEINDGDIELMTMLAHLGGRTLNGK